ncbi:MAG: dihydrolipoyl dehydrogenase [Chloroflexi bacterium]|nr:dihydrolipoyl dehydrogenase [Chloroflexota bacterium]
MPAEKFDVMVVGGGTGRDIVLAAEEQRLRVAVIEKGPLGGTCHNRGCMPSKMLIHSGDVAETSRSGERFGVMSRIEEIDFPSIVRNVFAVLDAETEEREEAFRRSEYVTFFQMEGRFIGPKSMKVGDREITADIVFIMGGTRPIVPEIRGVETVPYLTSDEALRLDEQPKRLVVIGGGYVAVELAHFFGSLGTEVTILVRGETLLDREDSEIAEWFSREFCAKHNVLFNTEAEELSKNGDGVQIKLSGNGQTISTDQLLFATGRRPNTDILDVAVTGVDLDEKGFIKVNEHLETNVDGVWALGDIVGIMTLKHVAVRQAKHVIRNVFFNERKPMRYGAIPHAVFSSPQVAAVGKTEDELKVEDAPYKVGRYEFKNTGMGMALKENGLVKVLASEADGILGCHIVGPDASCLIQEPVVAMNTTGKLDAIIDAVHAHPGLPQVVEEAFKSAKIATV